MFYNGFLNAPFDWLSSETLLLVLVVSFFAGVVCTVLTNESGALILTLFIAIGVSVFALNNQGTTDKLSEAKSINSESFAEKIIDVGKLDNLDNDSYTSIKDADSEKINKNAFFKLTGKKDGEVVDVVVEFDKNDTMTVKISPLIDEKDNTESFEYSPK